MRVLSAERKVLSAEAPSHFNCILPYLEVHEAKLWPFFRHFLLSALCALRFALCPLRSALCALRSPPMLVNDLSHSRDNVLDISFRHLGIDREGDDPLKNSACVREIFRSIAEPVPVIGVEV